MASTGSIRIGTSGWVYPHWRGPFYPRDLPVKRWFAYYADRFDTVEINNSFYRLPKKETFQAWHDAAPDGFLYAVKASRYITHFGKLQRTVKSYDLFLDFIAPLGGHLGPVLFQLPPGWKVNPDRLDDFLTHLPRHLRAAFEFRNPTWFTDEIAAILARHGAAFCIYDLKECVSPLTVTSDLVYVRLHGPEGAYGGSYADAVLDGWAERMIAWRAEGRTVMCYFDNDQAGYAVRDALRLKDRAAA